MWDDRDLSPTLSYSVRESKKAKRVSLRMSLDGNLEVVIPIGFDRSTVPAIVAKHQTWIDKTQTKLATQNPPSKKAQRELLPKAIDLQATTESWQVEYTPANLKSIRISEMEPYVILWGNTQNDRLCRKALKSWLTRRAEAFLIPWIQALSQDLELPCNRITVRGQKTRWGSCSNDGNISLNYKLLFLPPQLVRYVLIHELCHTIHFNHSPSYWQLVAEKDPHYKKSDQALKAALKYVPHWVDRD
ncbi:SprT family zinc-dependent metalloprotease [Alkalinema sp. FACHB-956]|uniref:M48 family metallopeptidase n=1 Tax=Alkalinema sp. FACHB-956 TaxID=2692768 RepID=UPI001687DD71|nr:SprT family zinc-dependent metalloprotease [Alkalinema sp. FACHB-956]MBD2329338.1 M48 family metallopeptidase [Alkalinema sp. FACHB-956]